MKGWTGLPKQLERPAAGAELDNRAQHSINPARACREALHFPVTAPDLSGKFPVIMYLTDQIQITSSHLNSEGNRTSKQRMICRQLLHNPELMQQTIDFPLQQSAPEQISGIGKIDLRHPHDSPFTCCEFRAAQIYHDC
ncbi:hypothetical protein D3C73_1209060 [compost metagenome]